MRDLEKQEKNFREQEVSLERDGETYLKAVRVLIKLKNEQVLTRELIESLIDKIYVYLGKNRHHKILQPPVPLVQHHF